nr:hypothetical protein [Candidatus Woesearchaeota archaeon]
MDKQQWLDDLANFIVEADLKTWAGNGLEVEPERKGYKELEYCRGEWRLRDSYTAYFRAPGMTTVYFKNKSAWTMAYGGTGQSEICDEIVKTTFEFLKETLRQVSVEMPFRGPREYIKGNWKYTFKLLKGDITDFLGKEEIYRNHYKIFTQTVLGGITIHKNTDGKRLYPWNF